MLRRDRDRFAEAQRVGFERAGGSACTFALVGNEDRGLAGSPHEVGECVIAGREPGPRVDQEQDGVGLLDREPRLREHAAG